MAQRKASFLLKEENKFHKDAPVWSLEQAAARPTWIWIPTPASPGLFQTLSQSDLGSTPGKSERARENKCVITDAFFAHENTVDMD